MKNTFKLLTVALVMTMATQSFGMFRAFANRFKLAADKSWNTFKTDVRSPKQIALKACAGLSAGLVSNFVGCGFVQKKTHERHFPTWKDRLRSPLVHSLAFCGAGAVAGPIGMMSHATAYYGLKLYEIKPGEKIYFKYYA